MAESNSERLRRLRAEQSVEGQLPLRKGETVTVHPPVLRSKHAAAHEYMSTACFHNKHVECRRVCKYCPQECICPCHKKKP
jgi:hypothetical protein